MKIRSRTISKRHKSIDKWSIDESSQEIASRSVTFPLCQFNGGSFTFLLRNGKTFLLLYELIAHFISFSIQREQDLSAIWENILWEVKRFWSGQIRGRNCFTDIRVSDYIKIIPRIPWMGCTLSVVCNISVKFRILDPFSCKSLVIDKIINNDIEVSNKMPWNPHTSLGQGYENLCNGVSAKGISQGIWKTKVQKRNKF